MNTKRGHKELLSQAQEAYILWQATFDVMMDAVIVTDPKGQIKQANNLVEDIFHLEQEDLIGQYCSKLFAQDQPCPHTLSVLTDFPVEREIFNHTKDRLLNLRVNSIIGANNQLIGFVHIARDITLQKTLERQLIHAERMTLAGQMVSVISHEAATPLSVVANIAEMLTLDFEPESQTSKELQKIVNQVQRVTELMRRMLNFVRRAPETFTHVELEPLVNETIELIAYEARKANIDISVQTDKALPLVWGDKRQLQQVFLNLLTNAIQAIKNKGKILIQLLQYNEPNNIMVIIEDNGPGIAGDAIEKLFDFFFTTRSSEGGTGLGLAITKQIIEGHGGSIKAENIKPEKIKDRGARFIITLPATSSQESSLPTD